MSSILPVGIDFGNLDTLTSVFEFNEKEPQTSTAVLLTDRNGNKKPSYMNVKSFTFRSQLFFDKGKRLSATAASINVMMLVDFIYPIERKEPCSLCSVH